MKKITVLLLSLCFVISFSACGGTNERNLNDEVERLNLQIAELSDLCNDLKNELEEIKNGVSQSQKEVTELKNEVELLTAKVDNLSGRSVTFTESAPVYSRKAEYIQFVAFDHHKDDTVSFEGFTQYCKNLFPNDALFLLKPLYDEYDFHPNRFREYSIFTEKVENGIPTNPIFYERMMMYSKVLGDKNEGAIQGDGFVPWSIDVEMFLAPLQKGKLQTPSLRFGKNNDGEYWTNYINIYNSDKCIATCYYRENAYVSEAWYMRYFNEYFINI